MDQPVNRAILLKNATCPYCGETLGPDAWNREHVVGRGFVPKGTLDGYWNLILRACKRCNSAKSDLEDDLSALSMQPSLLMGFPRDDGRLRSEAARKARSKSRTTQRPVGNSAERLSLGAQLGPGARATFGLVAPPQIDLQRADELALMHVQAFFYWASYDPIKRSGQRCPGVWTPLDFVFRTDWGNPIQKAFMARIQDWCTVVAASTAQGYFKIAIRRRPDRACWSWALEWNENVRLVGFVGEDVAIQEEVAELPGPRLGRLAVSDGSVLFRLEQRLDAADDLLFRFRDVDSASDGVDPK